MGLASKTNPSIDISEPDLEVQPRRDRIDRPRLEGDVRELDGDDRGGPVHPQVEERPGGAHRGPLQLARAASSGRHAEAMPATHHTDS